MTRTILHATLSLLAASPLSAGILFADNFDGGSTDLNGTAPDVRPGSETWVSSPLFNGDGSTEQGAGSATLAFAPVDGLVYTLDASFAGVAGDGDWFALGFVRGQSTGSTASDRFIEGNVIGRAWMLIKGDASGSQNSALMNGTANTVPWSAFTFENPGGDLAMRIVLDTTGGTGHWTVAWFAKRPADASYTEVRAATALLTEDINAVGLALSNPGVFGTITNFSLSDNRGDTNPPTLASTSPADDAVGVAVEASLVAHFDEPIRAGTGAITLKRAADNGTVESFDVSSSPRLGFGGTTVTITPSATLDPASGYFVQIDATAVIDDSGNSFGGIADATTWNFATAAAVLPLPPYAVDAGTRHLWHFDENDPGPAAPAAGVAGSFALVPTAGATLGAASVPGFGTAGDTSGGSDDGFRGSSIPVGAVTGPDGAFTFEAIIRTANITGLQQIITMDNPGGTADRPFQFRIDGGLLRFINIAGAVIASGGTQSIFATIPTTGPDSFAANEWFHVAVAYNGSENTPDNIRLFWTRVDATRTAASELLAATMTADLAGVATTFGVGQEYRSPDGNLQGRIDEVRISGIARGADDFLFLAPDTDLDGLADPWEILHFRESPEESDTTILAKYDGTADPDEDTFDNEAEETAGTDPNDASHTPLDADRDGYQDAWELAVFGTIGYGPADDPDGDGWATAEELAVGTDPANRLSNPDDTDGDGLEDATEMALFGNLAQGPFDDYDGDGVSNHGELEAGTDPTDAADFPEVTFVPVSDGNAATDENGYAGSSINAVAFIQNNLLTVGDRQLIAYYRRHATDAGHPDNNTIVIGRRNVGETAWEFFSTRFRANNIDDTHDVISFAIDGDGFLHISWGMHGDAFHYAKSTTPVLGADPVSMVAQAMTGQENSVTYPKFQTLPDGDLLYLFREGGSGSGDWYLNRYDTGTDTWAPVHANATGVQQPFMKGRGHTPDNCFYPDRMTLGPDGRIHLAGVFRYNSDSPAGESGYQTNHRYVYMRSSDEGVTWERSDGSAIAVPIVEDASFQNLGAAHVPEIVEDIPEGHSNMNEAGMTTDSAGRPIIANWWAANAASGDHTRQYHVFFHDGSNWHRRTVSARTIDNPATKYSESQLSSSWVGRPVVLTDAADRIIVVYNDNRFDGVTVVFSEPLAQDPGRNNWTRMNLTTENLGRWEATYDEPRWQRDGVLQMLYQKLPGSGADYGSQNNSTPVSIMEWNAKAYFHSPIRWSFDLKTTPGEAALSARTRTGFRYHLQTSTDLLFSDPPAVSLPGDGTWRDFGSWPMNEPRRFWRFERIEAATNDL